jgi:two-component system, NtrC family, sensor kinase
MLRFSSVNASAIGLLRVLLASSLLVPLVLFCIISWLNYRATINDADNDLERTSEVAREHAEKVFDSQAQLADRINDLTGGLSAAEILAEEAAMHTALNSMAGRLPHVSSAIIASKEGQPLVSAEVFPVPRDVDLHGRDYFDAIVGGDKGPFISRLQVGDVYRKPFFGLGRPWTDADGTFKGVVNVASSPGYFVDFYQVLVDESIGGTSGKIVALIRDNGQILARYPPFKSPPPLPAAPSAFLAAIAAAPDSGVYKSKSIIDPGAPLRLFAYRRVRGYPIYVVAGRSWDAILEEWRWTALGHLMFGAPLAVLLFAVTLTALTRIRREEAALLRANREIQRREAAEEALLRSQRLEAVGQMTGGVAHDFNNLLTVIAGNAALIEKRADDPSATRRFAAAIALAAKRGAEITHHLLAFAGRQTIRPETIDLNVRLRAFKPLLDRAASEAIQIHLDLGATLRPVSVDPGQFESAILNLVGNARDAMANGGRITITTRNADAAGGIVVVTVSDTGTGMDRETAAKAFEPFFTTKEIGKGTGLGLSQVYGFARQAGGDARIATAPGEGTTIEITLPASAAQPPVEAQVAAPMPHDPGGIVILVVEDEPNVLRLAVEILDDLGYVTHAAADAPAALRRLVELDRVDVLFTDMVMPGGMNGLQLYAEAKRLSPAIKVLLTSGYTGLAGDALPNDVTLLPKPYSREQLCRQLESMLERTP